MLFVQNQKIDINIYISIVSQKINHGKFLKNYVRTSTSGRVYWRYRVHDIYLSMLFRTD